MDSTTQPSATALTIKPVSKVEGYFILGTTMVGAVALSSFLINRLPKNTQFMASIIGQIFGIAIYGLGAPLIEPATSKFRQGAFGLRREQGDSFEGRSPTELEQFWWRTQANYSQNGQMARNIISHFLVSIQDNVTSAYRELSNAPSDDSVTYAAARVAEAAYRMRTLFTEFRAEEPAVAISVKTALGDHLPGSTGKRLREAVINRLREMDVHFGETGVEGYYTRLLASWLPPR